MGKKKRIKIQIKLFYSIVVGVLLISLFSYTSLQKITGVEYTAYIIQNYPIYKYILYSFLSSYILAFAVIIIELVIVFMFLFIRIRYAFLFSVIVLSFYSANILSLIVENEFFNCGCGLFYISSNPTIMFMFDLGLIIMLFSLYKTLKENDTDTLWIKLKKAYGNLLKKFKASSTVESK